MLYILPPPTAPKPPSPWDLIINFHRNGYKNGNWKKDEGSLEYKSVLSIPKMTIKDLFNFDRRNHKTLIGTCKLSSTHQAIESGGVKEEENKRKCKSLNECYFAGKCTVMMLSSNERLQRQPVGDGSRFCQISTELSSSQTSIGSVGSDIQQHLQSMFYLLRPEETLKMAVKLESLRAGRTRYLVVVSRSAKTLPSSPAKFTTSSTSTNSENLQEQHQPGNVTTQRLYTQQQPKEHQQQKNFQDQNCMVAAGCGMGSNSNMSTTETITSHSNTENIYHRCSINQNNNSNSNCSILFNTNSELSSVPIGGIAGSRSSANLTCDIQQLQQQKQQFTDDNLRRCHTATVSADRDENLVMGDTESNVSGSSGKSSSNDIEESCLLGIDCNENTTVGLVLKVMADTSIRLDGDGGFSVSVCGRQHIFKPVSVQAMWSALQTLYKISSKAQEHNFFAGGTSHDWVQYYEERIESDRSCLNEWHAMDSIESRRPPSPDTVRNKPTERDETERVIRTALKEIMMSVDLDEVTSKYIRGRLEEHLDMDLGEFKSFIDEEMLVILGQMDAPTEIFDHVYLGSEWNASNLEELQRNDVHHILNVTREIDNFFPGMFDYFNVRVYDDEKTDLLKHWDNTFKYITRAKADGSKVLVHCKMGISRSASVVIAYAMKAYNWDFEQAITHVKNKRSCIKPNKSFLSQLETYQGMLDAMKNKEKLQRSKSETNLKSDHVKDGRLLPGSEPTPLIQALQNNRNSTYPSSKKEAYYKRIKQRPNSSPDIPKATSDVVLLTKPLSVSLEALVSNNQSDPRLQPEVNCETTNLRWQNYSISQNQIIYLENESTNSSITSQQLETSTSDIQRDNCTEMSTNLPFVKSMISELELNEKKTKDDEQYYQLRKTDSWDPGENRVKGGGSVSIGDEKQVYNCSAEIIHQDSFDNIKTSSVTFTSSLSKISPAKKEVYAFCKQNDPVFDGEEIRQNKISIASMDPLKSIEQANPFVSRQSSWSSVDSACILGEHLPSRNSSWGSGDNRIIPSRNSSWGSYDTKFQQSTSLPLNALTKDVVMGQSGIFPYSQDEIPWHFGTVKRTKQKIEEKHTVVPLNVIKKSSSTPSSHCTATSIDAKNNNKILCDIKKSLLIDNLSNRTNSNVSSLRQRQEEMTNSYKTHSRCKSEEILTVQKGISLLPCSESFKTKDPTYFSDFNHNNINSKFLSASVPEKFSTSFLNSNISNNNSSSDETSTMTSCLKLQQRRQQFRKSSVSTDEPADKKINKNRDNHSQNVGKVRNLKMNFEAKANNQQIVVGAQKRLEDEKKGQSLPSSPIAIHINVSSTGVGFQNSIIEGVCSDDINVRGLVDKYEVTKMRTSARHPRPKSLFETKFNLKSFQHKQNQPLMMSHSTIFAKQNSMEENRKPPPMPPNQQPTVKSILLNTNQNLAINNSKLSGCRKQQLQHGKTHPLTKLGGIGKRLNATTAAAYNTM